MGNFITYASLVITAIAMVVVAYYAWQSHNLAEEIKSTNELKARSDDEFRQEIRDLYKGIIISNIGSGQSDIDTARRNFNGLYRQISWNTDIIEEIGTKSS